MSTVNERALKLLLADPGQCPTIGEERGRRVKEGISIFKSPHGSLRYVYSVHGQIVAALQVMVSASTAVATNIYTHPAYRRQGLARDLGARAALDFTNLLFSQDRSPDGQAWVAAMQELRRSTTPKAVFGRMAEQATIELSATLRCWNGSELSADKASITRHAAAGPVKVKITDFLTWLKSDAPFDLTMSAGSRDWRNQLIRLRLMAGVRPESFFEALIARNFVLLPNGHPRNYTVSDGTMYPTLERDGVRLSMSSGAILYEDRGCVMAGRAGESEWCINALMVDPAMRRQGLATAAMADICRLADQYGITIYLEPLPIQDKPTSQEVLDRFYAKFGFMGNGLVLSRQPGAQNQRRQGPRPPASEDFRRWFGQSRAVDEYGRPLLLFHGTRGDFTDDPEFRLSAGGEYGRGIYLTDHQDAAHGYAQRAKGEGGVNIRPVYLALQNPFVTTERGKVRALGMTKLREMGHDGIIATKPNGERQYVAFSPSQVRRALADVDDEDEAPPVATERHTG